MSKELEEPNRDYRHECLNIIDDETNEPMVIVLPWWASHAMDGDPSQQKIMDEVRIGTMLEQ